MNLPVRQKPAIIFDFGGVLIEWDPRNLYRKIFNSDETAMERFLAEVDFYEWNTMQDAGRSFADGVAAGCRQYPEYCHLFQAYNERWVESIRGPIDGTVAVLRDLKESGFTVYGLSNWSAEKFYQVRHTYPFFDWFEAIILSSEVKLAKPDPRIFHLTLRQIGRQAGDCLLIDDSPANIEAARRLGFQVIQFNSPEQLNQELAKYPWWSAQSV